jgi:hypothetical protein
VVRATISAAEGVLSENLDIRNERTFFVYPGRESIGSAEKLAVLDLSGDLKEYLRKAGIEYTRFDPSVRTKVPVLVSGYGPTGNTDQDIFISLFSFVRKGGTVVMLEGIGSDPNAQLSTLPFRGYLHRSRGLWTCIPHLVREHPIFDGLPANGMMRDTYENVWAVSTIRDLEGDEIKNVESVVASIGFDWFSQDHKMHYSGPGESWWGSDLAVVTFGKGRLILSQLRLVNNLGRDPVADIILHNLIRYCSEM